MTQEYQLETILAHAGINSDEATGALASPSSDKGLADVTVTS